MDSERQISNNENKKSEPKIKEGVDFVFEQNPGLASAAYEVLGFNNKLLSKVQFESILASPEANRIWESLLRQGIAKKIESGYKTIKKTITLEQEQQAKEIYSKYLDTIFSESKVKNIAYHDYDNEGKQFKETRTGIFTTGNNNWWQKGKYKYSLLINVLSPKIINTGINSDTAREFFSNPVNNDYDTLITLGLNDIDKAVYVLRTSKQIHILGSKQDVENFKKFIEEKNKNKDEKYLVE